MAGETINNEKRLLMDWFKVKKLDYSYDFLKNLKFLKRIIHFIPFLEQIGVCNSLAMGMADKDSDIDLLIITKKNRLYLVRLWMVFLFHIFKKRRHGNNVKGRFCLSFFIEEDKLDMKNIMIDNDYYFKHWVDNVWWLFDDKDFFGKWCSLNNLIMAQSLYAWRYNSGNYFSRFFDYLNFVLGIFQRLKAHKTYKKKSFPKGVIFEEAIVKCHDKDIRWKVRDFIESSLR
jgi:hypothetical protein